MMASCTDWEHYKVFEPRWKEEDELRKELKRRKLPTDGDKAELMERLEQAGPDLKGSPYGLLHHAISVGDAELLQKAFEGGATPRVIFHLSTWPQELDPLGMAIRQNRTSIVQGLIDAGAPLSGKECPLKQAAPLTTAAESGHTEIVRLLLKAGSPVDDHTENDPTPLWAAADEGRSGAVKALLAAGADITAKDARFGRTALHRAVSGASGPSLRTVTALLEHGADVTAQDIKGETPLDKCRGETEGEMGEVLRVLQVYSRKYMLPGNSTQKQVREGKKVERELKKMEKGHEIAEVESNAEETSARESYPSQDEPLELQGKDDLCQPLEGKCDQDAEKKDVEESDTKKASAKSTSIPKEDRLQLMKMLSSEMTLADELGTAPSLSSLDNTSGEGFPLSKSPSKDEDHKCTDESIKKEEVAPIPKEDKNKQNNGSESNVTSPVDDPVTGKHKQVTGSETTKSEDPPGQSVPQKQSGSAQKDAEEEESRKRKKKAVDVLIDSLFSSEEDEDEDSNASAREDKRTKKGKEKKKRTKNGSVAKIKEKEPITETQTPTPKNGTPIATDDSCPQPTKDQLRYIGRVYQDEENHRFYEVMDICYDPDYDCMVAYRKPQDGGPRDKIDVDPFDLEYTIDRVEAYETWMKKKQKAKKILAQNRQTGKIKQSPNAISKGKKASRRQKKTTTNTPSRKRRRVAEDSSPIANEEGSNPKSAEKSPKRFVPMSARKQQPPENGAKPDSSRRRSEPKVTGPPLKTIESKPTQESMDKSDSEGNTDLDHSDSSDEADIFEPKKFKAQPSGNRNKQGPAVTRTSVPKSHNGKKKGQPQVNNRKKKEQTRPKSSTKKDKRNILSFNKGLVASKEDLNVIGRKYVDEESLREYRVTSVRYDREYGAIVAFREPCDGKPPEEEDYDPFDIEYTKERVTQYGRKSK